MSIDFQALAEQPGASFAALRQQRERTLEEAAASTGITVEHLARFEEGKCSLPLAYQMELGHFLDHPEVKVILSQLPKVPQEAIWFFRQGYLTLQRTSLVLGLHEVSILTLVQIQTRQREPRILVERFLPSGRRITVQPGCGREPDVGISAMPPFLDSFADSWIFPNELEGLQAVFAWQPESPTPDPDTQELTGWISNKPTHRYRILGDPQLEYFKVEGVSPEKPEEFQPFLARCVRYALGEDRTLRSFEEDPGAPLPPIPAETRRFLLKSDHMIADGRICVHYDPAFLYAGRLVIEQTRPFTGLDRQQILAKLTYRLSY